jgi:hypothetical protein
MSTSSENYYAWVVRFWRENPLGPWRIALEAIPTGERRGFSDLESLCLYLQTHFNPEQPALKETQTDD